jgi:hypothetical protein
MKAGDMQRSAAGGGEEEREREVKDGSDKLGLTERKI